MKYYLIGVFILWTGLIAHLIYTAKKSKDNDKA